MSEEKKVEDLMTPDPVVAELPGNRRDVLHKMVKNKLTGMPVVKDEKLKGMITRKDFFDNPNEDQLVLLYNKNWPSITVDHSVEEAARLFIEKNIHYLPVKGGNNGEDCVGILTTADMLSYIEEKNIDKPVEEVVRRQCIPLYDGTPIQVAVQMMSLTGIYAFPVVDDETRLEGIITDRDLFNLTEISADIAISELGLEENEDKWSWQGLKNVMKLYYEESKIELPKVTVKEVMIEDPLSVYDKTSVSEAARLMMRNDFGQLPIVDELDNLEAMVYELDLIEAIL